MTFVLRAGKSFTPNPLPPSSSYTGPAAAAAMNVPLRIDPGIEGLDEHGLTLRVHLGRIGAIRIPLRVVPAAEEHGTRRHQCHELV